MTKEILTFATITQIYCALRNRKEYILKQIEEMPACCSDLLPSWSKELVRCATAIDEFDNQLKYIMGFKNAE